MNIEETTSKAGVNLHRAQESPVDSARTANETLDAAQHGTAELESAASSVRAIGHGGAETTGTLADSAAGKLQSMAGPAGSHHAGSMLVKLRHMIGRHPARFLIVAAGLAYLARFQFRRAKPHE